jgi:hypothetical protein
MMEVCQVCSLPGLRRSGEMGSDEVGKEKNTPISGQTDAGCSRLVHGGQGRCRESSDDGSQRELVGLAMRCLLGCEK